MPRRSPIDGIANGLDCVEPHGGNPRRSCMFQPDGGTVRPMEETPILASVERDLQLSLDELVYEREDTSSGTAATTTAISSPSAKSSRNVPSEP